MTHISFLRSMTKLDPYYIKTGSTFVILCTIYFVLDIILKKKYSLKPMYLALDINLKNICLK